MKNKLILKDGKEIEIDGNVTYGLKCIVVKNETLDSIEEKLTVENLQEIEIICGNRINGKFYNLELVDLRKNFRTKQITIS